MSETNITESAEILYTSEDDHNNYKGTAIK